jgi:hypothetical protein
MSLRRNSPARDAQDARIPWIPILGVLVGVAEAFAIKFLFHVEEPIYGFIVALITVVMSLQIDQIARTQEAIERARVDGVFGQKLRNTSWVRQLLEEVVDSAAIIDDMPDNEVFVRRAKVAFEECKGSIGELARGRIRTKPEEYCQVVIPMASKARKLIRGVAVMNPRNAFEWWDTSQGKEYWKRNMKALGDGVHIERIFAYQAEQNRRMPEGLQRLARSQAEEGVKVFTVETAQLPPDLRVDLAIFDEDSMYELRLSADGEPLRYLCSKNPEDIRRRIGHFDIIKSYATPLPPDTAEEKPPMSVA